MNDFYRLVDDEDKPTLALGHPIGEEGTVHAENFVVGKSYRGGRALSIECLAPGPIMDLSFAVYYMLVVRKAVGDAIFSVARNRFERIGVLPAGHSEELEILNILDRVDCIDLQQSVFEHTLSTVRDEEPLLHFKAFYKLRIDASRASGNDIFRPSGWPWAVIVSERIKNLITDAGFQGVCFEKVS